MRVSESAPPDKRLRDASGGSGIGQGDMYHIFAPQGHGQDGAALRKNQSPVMAAIAAPAHAPRLVQLLASVLARVGGVDQQVNPAGTGRSLDPFGAVDEVAGAGLHAEA